MKGLRLKKEIKLILIHTAIIFTLILCITLISRNDKKAYEECMIKNNNNANLCKNLLR